MTWCESHSEGVVLSLLIQPRASRCEVCGVQGDRLKLRLTSPPVEGAANKLCCEFLAKYFGIAKGAAVLISGDRSRQKRVLLRGVGVEEVLRVLGGETP